MAKEQRNKERVNLSSWIYRDEHPDLWAWQLSLQGRNRSQAVRAAIRAGIEVLDEKGWEDYLDMPLEGSQAADERQYLYQQYESLHEQQGVLEEALRSVIRRLDEQASVPRADTELAGQITKRLDQMGRDMEELRRRIVAGRLPEQQDDPTEFGAVSQEVIEQRKRNLNKSNW